MRLSLRVAGQEVSTYTVTVSQEGFSARLPALLPIGTVGQFKLKLPDGEILEGAATCRNVLADGLTGFSLEFHEVGQVSWDAFIKQEESTGSLWRMIGRYTRSEDTDGGGRDVIERQSPTKMEAILDSLPPDDGAPTPTPRPEESNASFKLRFHSVGENGEAYRIAFEKRPSDLGIDSPLCQRIPGFDELAERAVGRVLRQPVTIKASSRSPVQQVFVCELTRGGYAYAQGDEKSPAVLVSLVVGELILIEAAGRSVYPHFDEEDLERVACDAFSTDLDQPVFTMPAGNQREVKPDPVTFNAPLSLEGIEAIRRAQAHASDIQTRKYGTRNIHFFPQVWAKATLNDGTTAIGPTMRDGERVLLLILVGTKAPRVTRIDRDGVDCSLFIRDAA